MQQADSEEKLVICLGRFQPFHNGHYGHIQELIEQGYTPIVVIPNHVGIPREPFTFEQRKNMIEIAFRGSPIKPLVFPLESRYKLVDNPDNMGGRILDITEITDEIVNLVETEFPMKLVSCAAGDICESYQLIYQGGKIGTMPIVESFCQHNPPFSKFIWTHFQGEASGTDIRRNFIQRDARNQLKLAKNTNGRDVKEVMNPAVVDYINAECSHILSAIYEHYHKQPRRL